MYIRHYRFLPFIKEILIPSFGRTKLHKKESINIYFFYLLKKVSTALVQSNI